MEAGLTADIELCDTSEEGRYRAGLRLLDRPTAEQVTAVFAASDLMRSASCRPRPNSTTPYWPTSLWSASTNTHLAKIGSIRLTSVDIHLYEQCSLCGDTLVKHIADPGWASTEQLVDHRTEYQGNHRRKTKQYPLTTGVPVPIRALYPRGSFLNSGSRAGFGRVGCGFWAPCVPRPASAGMPSIVQPDDR